MFSGGSIPSINAHNLLNLQISKNFHLFKLYVLTIICQYHMNTNNSQLNIARSSGANFIHISLLAELTAIAFTGNKYSQISKNKKSKAYLKPYMKISLELYVF